MRILCAVLVFLAMPAKADQPLVTDRPDFTESAQVVPRGKIQVESGFTIERSGDARVQSWGEVLVRIPTDERTEIRIGVPSYLRVQNGGSQSGFDDGFLGFKRVLKKGEGSSPQVALLAGTTIPTGSRAVAERKYQPEVVLAASLDLSPKLGLGANAGYARASSDGQRFGQLFGSVALGYELGERWGCYAEVFAFSRDEPGGSSREYFNAGVTYAVSDDFQLDARLGRGLNDERERFWGIGASRRF